MGARLARRIRFGAAGQRDALKLPCESAKLDTVPLSEEEQRILHEIERSFYAGEQAGGSSATSRLTDVRRVRLAALGFVVSLVLLLVGFA